MIMVLPAWSIKPRIVWWWCYLFEAIRCLGASDLLKVGAQEVLEVLQHRVVPLDQLVDICNLMQGGHWAGEVGVGWQQVWVHADQLLAGKVRVDHQYRSLSLSPSLSLCHVCVCGMCVGMCACMCVCIHGNFKCMCTQVYAVQNELIPEQGYWGREE